MDILNTLLTNLPWTAVAGIATGAIRNVPGYIENYLKDGKKSPFDYKQLAGTIVKYFAFITLLSFGLDPSQSITAAFGIDVGQSVIKNAKA
jgi:hypothetical protein